MNFLSHLCFSPSNSIENTIGIVIGNTAKSQNLAKYNLEILKGIAMDMQIRVFSENHPVFHRSMQRVDIKYRSKYSSFIVKIFYDHLLAKNWGNYFPTSLNEFSEKTYSIIQGNLKIFPYKIRKYANEMLSKKWITEITSIGGTHEYLKMLSKKERFTSNLDQCLFELTENYQQYRNDFEEYFQSLLEFMEQEAKRFNTASSERELFLLSA